MPITRNFIRPVRSEGEDIFNAKANDWAEDWELAVPEINALEDNVEAKEASAVAAAATAVTKAGESLTSATNADISATNAAASAASAAAVAGAFVGTSATSLTIGSGNKTFVTQAGEMYTTGIFMTAVSAGNTTNYMAGQVVSYSGTSLVINVSVIGGSGAHNDWNLSIAGPQGQPGTGITADTDGFHLTGGTTAKTLTVDSDLTTSMVNSILSISSFSAGII